MSTRQPKKKAYHHGDLRDALISTALDLLQNEAADALSLRRLAQHSGVTAAAVYRHFNSKEELLAAIATEGFREMIRFFENTVQQAHQLSASELLIRLGEDYIAFALQHPHHFRIMFSQAIQDFSAYPLLQEVAQQAFQYLYRAIEAGNTDNKAQIELKAAYAWSLVHGFTMLKLEGLLKQNTPTDALLRLTSTLFSQ
jgi:AcrR family transcriptional regulator